MAEPYRKGNTSATPATASAWWMTSAWTSPPAKAHPRNSTSWKPVSNPASTIFVPTGSPALVEKMARLPNREELDQLILSVKDHPLRGSKTARPAWPAFKPL